MAIDGKSKTVIEAARTITDNQARAIVLIELNGGWVHSKKAENEIWYKGGIEPSFYGLLRNNYIRSNGMPDEYMLTDEGREAYSAWYAARGFKMDLEIERWRNYAYVIYTPGVDS